MAYFSAHRIKRLVASSGATSGAPLTVELLSGDGRAPSDSVVIFTNDQDYTDALVAAINAVNVARATAKVVAFDPEAA
jgi:hypothetical protein